MALAGRGLLIAGGTGSFGQCMMARPLSGGAGEVRVFSQDKAKQEAMRARLRKDRARHSDPDAVAKAAGGVGFAFHAAALNRCPRASSFRWKRFMLSTVRRRHKGGRHPGDQVRSHHVIVIDAAGGGIGGHARWSGELTSYLADTRAAVRVIGRGRRLTPGGLVRRERLAAGADLAVVPNNAAFAFVGSRQVTPIGVMAFTRRAALWPAPPGAHG